MLSAKITGIILSIGIYLFIIMIILDNIERTDNTNIEPRTSKPPTRDELEDE